MKSSFLVSVILLGLAATLRPAAAADVRMYVRHEVSDYAAWRKGYDAFNAARRSMGVKGAAVYLVSPVQKSLVRPISRYRTLAA
jgi:hypothetical protein